MDDSKRRRLIIILILILIVMIISATYAYFLLLVSKEEDSTKLYTGTLDVQYSQGNLINGELFYPREEPISLDDTFETYVNYFTITNTGTLDGYVKIRLDVIESGFPDEALKYKIFNGNGSLFMSGSISSMDSYTLASNIFMRSGESADYALQIWLQENNAQQNKSKNKRLVAAIEVTETQIME